MTHYWPICSGSMLDQIGSAHMTQGDFTDFTTDRFGNSNSALGLNGGWTQAPSGIYFDTREFTISVWVYPQQVGTWARIIDFGNGPNADDIFFAFSYGDSQQPSLQIYSGPDCIITSLSSQAIAQSQWQFLVATFDGTNSNIYLNGQLIASVAYSFNLTSLFRSNCFIGRSNWIEDGFSSSYLDELRFYNKSLSQVQILELMNQNETC